MSKVMVTESYLQDVADAIREKGGTDTYTPAEMGDAIRALPSGGGSSFNLIHEEDLGEISTTSTSSTTIKTISINPASDIWRHDKVVFITIRDKNGPRTGYFYGTDNVIINRFSAAGTEYAFSAIYHMTYSKNDQGEWVTGNSTQTITSTAYGVFCYTLQPAGNLLIRARYAAATTWTIDGDFTLKVYTLDWPEGSPFLA